MTSGEASTTARAGIRDFGRRLQPSLRTGLERLDHAVHWRSAVQRLVDSSGPSYRPSLLPPSAEQYLRPDHPRLIELRDRYRSHPAAATSLWNGSYLRQEVNLRYFRGDNAFIWQQRNHTCAAAYALTAQYVLQHDRLGLLDRLDEDGAFGVHTYDVDGLVVSRDLLDSVIEVTFLEDALEVSRRESPTILDIGAGYGRLAHRTVAALDGVSYLCTDAVAVSTFLCEYYLSFRKADRAEVVPLYEVDAALGSRRVDVAVNVHSFVECPAQATAWWLDLLAVHRVRWLIIVSSRDELYSRERSGQLKPLSGLIESKGFELVSRQEKYPSSRTVQELGVAPSHHFLFRARG